MGWEIRQFSKEDPDSILICRNHASTDIPILALSVDEQRTPIIALEAPYRRIAKDKTRPMEIQITNSNGQTAIIFLYIDGASDALIVHGQIEGRRHQYGWRTVPFDKYAQRLRRVLTFHVTAEGMIVLTPVKSGNFSYAFSLMDGTELQFEKLELKIPMFSLAQPPSYQAAVA